MQTLNQARTLLVTCFLPGFWEGYSAPLPVTRWKACLQVCEETQMTYLHFPSHPLMNFKVVFIKLQVFWKREFPQYSMQFRFQSGFFPICENQWFEELILLELCFSALVWFDKIFKAGTRFENLSKLRKSWISYSVQGTLAFQPYFNRESGSWYIVCWES
jgi:hypothetical protein